jgi:predicted AAA+ superfamily ATPase
MKLKRKDLIDLERWWSSPLRERPCVLFGARQVGKSTLALDFAKSKNREPIVVNFWKDDGGRFSQIFRYRSSAQSVLTKLETLLERKISAENSILILDEIQACPAAYTLCKSFCEDTNLPVIATGSYLKLFLTAEEHDPDFEVPIGCTYEKLVTPLTYSEYLQNANSRLYDFFCEANPEGVVDDFYHQELLKHFYDFLFVGGMPDAIKNFLTLKQESLLNAIEITREIQNGLLLSYQNDFLNNHLKQRLHGKIASKVNATFHLIAQELQKQHHTERPVQRFRLKSMGEHTSYQRVANVFEYLVASGLILRTDIIRDPTEPILPKVDQGSSFKCYYWDTGMLNAQLQSSYTSIVENSQNSYKGYIAENFVAQHLSHNLTTSLISWSSRHYEIEFLLREGSGFIPLEVKASKRNARSPSLSNYIKNYSPSRAIKIAPRNFGTSPEFTSIPIYFVEKLSERLSS